MVNAHAIKPHMPVVCSEGGQFATVDHLEGRYSIKLTRDKGGQHHYIPASWVTTIDDKVHIDRPGDRAMKEWSTSPGGSRGDPDTKRSLGVVPDPTHTERVRSQQSEKAPPKGAPKRSERPPTKH